VNSYLAKSRVSDTGIISDQSHQEQIKSNNLGEFSQTSNTSNNSLKVKQLKLMRQRANTSPKAQQITQLQTLQRQENKTGLPDKLKNGLERLSGYSMDDVRVHRNSDKPAQFQAHAYAQGSNIHLAPGQEQHLPHEAWHVVQQKQNRVKATGSVGGMALNDSQALESEATRMGNQAMQLSAKTTGVHESDGLNLSSEGVSTQALQAMPIQRSPWLLAAGGLALYGLYRYFSGGGEEPAPVVQGELALVLQQVADARGLTGIRELEVRLSTPSGVLGSYVVDRPNATGAQVYQELIGNGDGTKFAGSCGQTSSFLKDATFGDGDAVVSNGRNAVCQAIENADDDTYIRVQVGCHSFMVEKTNGTCRVYQSYFGYDALADTIPMDQAMPTNTFVDNLRHVIDNPPVDGQPNDPVTEQMFHGTVDSTAGLVRCEVPQQRKSTAQVTAYINNRLDANNAAWTAIAASDQTVMTLFGQYA